MYLGSQIRVADLNTQRKKQTAMKHCRGKEKKGRGWGCRGSEWGDKIALEELQRSCRPANVNKA